MITTINEVTWQQRLNKGTGLIVFRNVSLVCFTAEFDE